MIQTSSRGSTVRRQGRAKHFPSCLLIAVFCLLFASPSFANNLKISSIRQTARDTSANTITIQFNMSWDWSWSDGSTDTSARDAVWVFMKYSTDQGLNWRHATLSASGTNPSGFSSGNANYNVIVPTAKRGAFFQYNTTSSGGAATLTSAKLVWDYSTDGLKDETGYRIKIFGIEMIYIPTNAFWLGDSTVSNVTGQFTQGTSDVTINISSESSLTLGGSSAGNLRNNNTSGMAVVDDFTNSTTKSLPAAFPKGYAAFYLMKYEITEGQWVDFFNTLTPLQKSYRDITGGTLGSVSTGKGSDGIVYRNTVSWADAGDATTSRPDRAMGFISSIDLMAYLDWAALRPMTEMEFEKAARGTSTVSGTVANEYAWGSTTIINGITIAGTTEDGTETISTSSANCNYDDATTTAYVGGDGGTATLGLGGPLRVGIFATGTSTRVLAGAGYYGNMNLSGNLYEKCVSVGDSISRTFTGSHGNGTLSANGFATNSDWPGYVSATAEVSGNNYQGGGLGFRGGGIFHAASFQRTSDRAYANLGIITTTNYYKDRSPDRGGRGARTFGASD